MRFVIEAAGLAVAGGKELALDLMTHLAAHREHQFTFLVPGLPAYQSLSGGKTYICRTGSGLLHRANQLNHEVPRICRREGADALLCLGNFAPWTPVCPTAVLLQNAWITYGDLVAESRRTVRELVVTAYGRNAYRHLPPQTAVITQTAVMKAHLCQRYGIAPGRVAVIPNTLSLARLAASARCGARGASEGEGPFIFLCLAHYYAHKNIEILADAMRKLPDYTERPAKCVITIAPEQHPRARRLLEQLDKVGLADEIENVGPVPSEMLSEVYRRADALIFPTLLESCSRSYLEAMHFGLPILTSDRDFARHLCRDAAIYFDPLDAESVAQAMARVMEDAALRQKLTANGRRILAEAPTWEEIAARFVDVLERTARGELPITSEAARDGSAPQPARELASIRKNPGLEGRKSPGRVRSADQELAIHDVRTLFNQKARRWGSKYGPEGTLNRRVELFTSRLAKLCPAPAAILDLGCGTGEIAAAIAQRGYGVTACDIAEGMMKIARRSHPGAAVEWVCLDGASAALPFADGSFDGVVASSVFEYLDDLKGTAAELARVVRPEGIMLLTVPNPSHLVRKIEARLGAVVAHRRIPPPLGRLPRLNAYLAYLRLSRNRLSGAAWHSVLNAARFAPLDETDFSPGTWQLERTPLVLLAVKRMPCQAEPEWAFASVGESRGMP